MSNLIIPEGYKPILSKKQTERSIKLIKDYFQQNLAAELKLTRVTAPLFVQIGFRFKGTVWLQGRVNIL